MAYDETTLLAIGIILPLIALGLRFHVRLKVRPQPLGWDDWLALIAGALLLEVQIHHFIGPAPTAYERCLFSANAVVGIYLGLNGHQGAEADPTHWGDRGRMNSKLTYIVVVMEKAHVREPSSSASSSSSSAASSPFRTFRKITDVFIVLTALWALVYTFLEIFQCGTHVTAQWTAPELCSSRYGLKDHPSVLLSFAITDVISDVAILVLPFPIMRRLHRRPRERWGIAGIFALGWISAAAGAVRLYYVVHATKIDQDALRAENPIPVYMPPSTWTFTELCVGITAANLPPLAPLIRKAPSAAAKAKMSISSSWLSIRSTRNGSTTVPVSVKEVVDETHVHTLDQYRITQCRRPIDGHDSQIGPLQVPESLVLAGSDTGEVYRASSPRRYHSEMVRVRLSLG